MENFKRYRAFWIGDDLKQHYVRGGKFYKTLSACKCGIRTHDWCIPAGTEREYIIEEYVVLLTENTYKAKVRKTSPYHAEVKYEENK